MPTPQEVFSFEDVLNFANDNDGECVVCLAPNQQGFGGLSTFVVESSEDRHDIGEVIDWDYFFSDEAELFDCEKYSI